MRRRARRDARPPPRCAGAAVHAVKVTGALFHTQGGLDIDAHCRVLRDDGAPFANLLAAGGAARGVSGDAVWGYLSGNGLLSAVAGGCIAARTARRPSDGRTDDDTVPASAAAGTACAARARRLRRPVRAASPSRAASRRCTCPARRSPTPASGRSDIGLTTCDEVADTLARITERVALPVIVDADTGFGNALNVQRTVRELRARRRGDDSARGPDLPEALRPPRRQGASCRVAEMCGKLRAALDARVHADTLILARTDALAVEGLDAALERAEAYLDVRRRRALHRGLAHARTDGRGVRALRRTACRCWPTWSKAARRRCRTPTSLAAARLSHRHLSGRHRACGRAHAVRLLREPASARQHRALARG